MTGLLAAPGRAADPGPAESLRCTAVTQVTHDVRTFSFAPVRGWAGHAPGQHVVLDLEVAGGRVRRCYTLSSSPTRPDELAITVKRVPGGVVSAWLHDHVRVGDRLRADGPRGSFSTTGHPARRHLFLSAGSGITPLMSMTRAALDTAAAGGAPCDVAFVHHARTPADVIFRAELEAVAARRAGVAVTVVCERDSATETWGGRRGLLDAATLLDAVPDLLDREVFTCGPPGYLAAARAALAALGVDPHRCHQESFEVALPPAAAAVGPPPAGAPAAGTGHRVTAGTGHRVTLRRSGAVVDCAPGETVLESVLRNGHTVASSCGEGMCGTCITTVLDGTVEMAHQGGIRPREIAAGKVLLCCSTPTSALVLDA